MMKPSYFMIRWNKFDLFIFFLLLTVNTPPIFSQNLYDIEHSLKFADYLFASGQYQLAAEEYERVVFLDPQNTSTKLKLVKSYKLNGDLMQGINRIMEFHQNSPEQLTLPFSEQFVQMNLRLGNYPEVTNLLQKNTKLPESFVANSRLSIFLLEAEWSKAQELVEMNPANTDAKLFGIVEESMALKYRKPWIGTSLSIILPGSGKVYAGRWKDGIISFIFIAGSAWQAYRGFDKFGTQSVYGWIFGSVSLGFYTGNIYGSWKAVKQYNSGLDGRLQHKAEHIIFNH